MNNFRAVLSNHQRLNCGSKKKSKNTGERNYASDRMTAEKKRKHRMQPGKELGELFGVFIAGKKED